MDTYPKNKKKLVYGLPTHAVGQEGKGKNHIEQAPQDGNVNVLQKNLPNQTCDRIGQHEAPLGTIDYTN